jgi:O-antigen/teichoic acid export membrane protein
MIEQTLKNIAKGTIITFGGIVVGTILQFLTRVIFARGLGPNEYGQLILALSLLYIVGGIASFSFGTVLARFLSYYNRPENLPKQKGILISAFMLIFLISIFVTFVFFVLADDISISIFNMPELVPILHIFSLILPIFAFKLLFAGALRGYQQMGFLAISEQIFAQGALVILGVFFIWTNIKLVGVSIGYSLAIFMTTFLTLFFLLRSAKVFSIWGKIEASYDDTRSMFIFSLPIFVSQQLGQLRGRVDTLLLATLATASEVGIYNVAVPVARLLMLGLSSINGILLPSLSQFQANKDFENLKYTYKASSFWVLFLTFPLFLFIVTYPHQILEILFGKQYTIAKSALLVLSCGLFINIISGPFGETLVAVGRPFGNTLVSVVSLTSSVILNIILIPVYGIVGAALASTLSLFLASVVGGGYLYYHEHIQPFSINHVKLLLILGGLFYLLNLLSTYLPDKWSMWFVVSCIPLLYIFGLFGLSRLYGIGEVEMKILKQIVARFKPAFLFKTFRV